MNHNSLENFFNKQTHYALGFSGGVDSSYLLYAGLKSGARIQPYFIKTVFQPSFELDDARKICDFLNVELKVITSDILDKPSIASNPADRCYHCKRHIFSLLKEHAAKDGYDCLIDGSNASDDAADRPGLRAIAELGVMSPLRDCGLTKTEIRVLSREAGLFTGDKPAYACLATRCPVGQVITEDVLSRVEKSEDALMKMGFTDFRVRVTSDGLARLQCPAAQMSAILANKDAILNSVLFPSVLLDLCGR